MLSKVLKPIDDILNLITMYRLMLYYLILLWIFSLFFSFFKFLPFSVLDLLISTPVIIATCWITNRIFAKIFNVVTNFESVYISALIISLIISPVLNFQGIIFVCLVSFIAMASKYVLVINKKHIFNPVAIAVFIPSILTIGSAGWWIGTQIMLVPILLGGLLIARKIQRVDLVLTYIIFYSLVNLILSKNNGDIYIRLFRTLFDAQNLFFAFVMLVEPLTTPARREFRIIYGAAVGILSFPQLHIFNFYLTPERTLLIGNIVSYFINPRTKLILTLKEKKLIAPSIYDFIFRMDKKFNFIPGQYLEWTLNVGNPDSRGNRRYFTISSSPTEDNLRIGVKTYVNPSIFKKKLFSLNPGDKVIAGELSGDFTIPQNPQQPLIFIAGGIGITPFRSILKYLLDKNIKLPITLFYSNKNFEDIVYKDILELGQKNLGIRTIYNLTNLDTIPSAWKGFRGKLTEEIIKKEVPDYKKAKFYLSGPHSMVVGFEDVLKKMGIKKSNIKKDFFPGYV